MTDRHASSPIELKQRIAAEQRGAPFLAYRDHDGHEQIRVLDVERLDIGRTVTDGLRLGWDEKVSRVHAQLLRLGEGWAVVDDGLSRNGTFLNGERLQGRRRLADGDTLRFGATTVRFHEPTPATGGSDTAMADETAAVVALSPTQRRVLAALARPYRGDAAFAAPATNRPIADEVCLGPDAVKAHLTALFEKFAIKHLPQNQKRVELVARALNSGAITERALGR